MSHDKNGTLIQPGDTVTLECVVESITPNEEFCNLNMRPVEPMYPSDRRDLISAINAKQVLLTKKKEQ